MSEALTTLANWRTQPHNHWSFQHVERLVECATVPASSTPLRLPAGEPLALHALDIKHADQPGSALEALGASDTDGFMVLHRGQVVAEHYAHGQHAASRHIIFSVSKSVTGALAGVLVQQGLLDPQRKVSDYLPIPPGSAYAQCSVRQVLDMTVNIQFIEDYLDPTGDVARYRVAMAWNPPGLVSAETGLLEFVANLPEGNGAHGECFHYVSPNSDLLGWLLAAVSGETIAELIARYLWEPMGAAHSSCITLDRQGAARTAGGFCCTLSDMARLGELLRNGGIANGNRVLPGDWVQDIYHGGDAEAWARGDMTELFASGRYRSQWYSPGTDPGVLCAVGIHGQWIWIDTMAEVVIVKQSSQALPDDERLNALNLALFRAVCATYRA